MSVSRADQRRWVNPVAAAAIALAGLTGLTGCQSGPDPITDGSYRLLATSTGATTDPTLTATIAGSSLTLRTPTSEATATIGSPGPTFVLCPPKGRGQPMTLGNDALTVDQVTLTRPAIFGDCASTTPERITLVDLDGVDTSRQLPFTRWAEFCRTGSRDC